MPATARILSIDGGGIRGIISALVLEHIEERTEAAIADLFHMIAGASTGSILAVGLSMPNPDNGPKFSLRGVVQPGYQRTSKPSLPNVASWLRTDVQRVTQRGLLNP